MPHWYEKWHIQLDEEFKDGRLTLDEYNQELRELNAELSEWENDQNLKE
jgi:hypothetical protein